MTGKRRGTLDKVFVYKQDCGTFICLFGVRRGRDRMVVGFTTTYAISAYHH